MKTKYQFELKAGKRRRYIVWDDNTIYTSIRHYCMVNKVSEGRVHKEIKEFLEKGYKMNTRDRVTTSFMFNGNKVKVTILNYNEN